MFYKRLKNELHHHFLRERTALKIETSFDRTVLFTERPQSSNEIKDVNAELHKIYRQQMGNDNRIAFSETVAFL